MGMYKEGKEFFKDSIGFIKKITKEEEIESLKKEIESLKKEIKDSKLLFFEGDLYWKLGEDEKKEGPFCPGCWDSNQNPIRMVSIRKGGAINSGWSCTVCPFKKVEYNNNPIHIPRYYNF